MAKKSEEPVEVVEPVRAGGYVLTDSGWALEEQPVNE